MMCEIFWLCGLAVLIIGVSLTVREKINPVDLKYYCVRVTPPDEKVQEKVPVLLIHGAGASHKEWDGVNLHLSFLTKRKVCAIDLRNHGDSPWNKRTDVKAFAADIGQFLDKQGIKKVNIIGHSLGGKVAVHFTLTNPNRVNSIVVEDMRPNGITKEAYNHGIVTFEVLKEALANVPARATEEKAREIILNFANKNLDQIGGTEKLTRKSLNFLQLKLVDGRWRFKHDMDLILKGMKDADKFLGKSSGIYKGLALFIYGEQSPFKIGEDKDNILKLFPKAKLVPVEGAGHIIHGEFRQFDDEVVKFLSKVN